ncbi:hypothetical protein ZWY2020_021663 [Hordeum vulgare]|nr:hypothetical protein ZWY2020_021663 [Hordeum vulgare]
MRRRLTAIPDAGGDEQRQRLGHAMAVAAVTVMPTSDTTGMLDGGQGGVSGPDAVEGEVVSGQRVAALGDSQQHVLPRRRRVGGGRGPRDLDRRQRRWR